MTHTTRRRFLYVSALALAGGAGALVFTYPRRDGRAARAVVELSGSFRDLESARAVGAAAVPSLPEAADRDQLLELVAPERGSAALLAAIREEHRRGETVLIEGWHLAVTEARLFALVALAEPDPRR